jgi:membrane-associated phospholipid phosphatase
MPSGWALLFGATVGLVGALALRNARGTSRWVYAIGCAVVLAAGLAARVSLGQPWPSDVIAGYLLAITLGLAVLEVLVTLGRRPSRSARAGAAKAR